LKLVRHLFTWSQDAHLADFYERGLNNGVLGILKAPGIFIYLLPLGSGSNKGVSPHGWGTLFDSFWCCYGTGIESMSKLADSIYFSDQTQANSVIVAQYVSSRLEVGKSVIEQQVLIPDANSNYDVMTSTLRISSQSGEVVEMRLKLRLPESTTSTFSLSMNGQSLTFDQQNGFLIVDHQWNSSDVLEVSFPMTFRMERINDDRDEYQNLFSVLYGPFVLAGKWEFTDTKAALCWQKGISLENQFIPINSENKNLASFAAQDGSGFVRHSGYVGWISPLDSPTDREDSTFRAISNSDKSLSFESFNYIGHYITNVNGRLTIVKASSADVAPRFMQVKALDGDPESFSLMSDTDYMVVRMVSGRAEVHFAASDNTQEFKNQASFKWSSPNAQYHPLSFRTSGCERDLVFFPLNQMLDERYSVYFDIGYQ
jgi:hypothetical protein